MMTVIKTTAKKRAMRVMAMILTIGKMMTMMIMTRTTTVMMTNYEKDYRDGFFLPNVEDAGGGG